MAIEDDFQNLVENWRAERSKLETLKSRKVSLQSEIQQINDQITAQVPIVQSARIALKQKATEI